MIDKYLINLKQENGNEIRIAQNEGKEDVIIVACRKIENA